MPAPIYANTLDTDLLSEIQDKTLEPRNGGASMVTAQFGTTPANALQAVIDALNQAQMDFLRDTGVVAWNISIGVAAGTQRVDLPQDMSDVRRRGWRSLTGI